ncbi:SOS response-associated peptidase [Herbaspirillum robiniae]|uniref:SOS response-associated peptidase n=1 Tax=Herbaspirillum robiniae TaxID=2014887 RepID=UPI0009A159D0|nr:SOS response-associated peptidase family protein [Herbaspirillum robiniae]
MCVNYKPTDAELLAAMRGKSTINLPAWKDSTYQDYDAPIIRGGAEGDEAEILLASYGMIPKDKMPPGVRLTTMNARAETIGEKRSYSSAWRAAQTCLVPMTAFYEPNWESGKAERWAIGMADGSPFYVAGLWRAWDDGERYSFTQLTMNADDHPLMKRFHKPGDEKRSLVVIPQEQAEDWLQVGNPEIARAFMQLFPADLMAAAPAEKGYGGKR